MAFNKQARAIMDSRPKPVTRCVWPYDSDAANHIECYTTTRMGYTLYIWQDERKQTYWNITVKGQMTGMIEDADLISVEAKLDSWMSDYFGR